ncbi:MAG: nucleoside kinase [Christensenellales bacterium]|jgi:uridine kinase
MMTCEVRKGETYADAAKRLGILAMGVQRGGETISLEEVPKEGDSASFILYSDSEGRRIYERSLSYVLLMACKEVIPNLRVRIENSTGAGFFAYTPDAPLPLMGRQVARIEKKMREIVAKNLPFTRVEMSTEDARAMFTQNGETDKARLMKYRPSNEISLFRCGEMLAYFYGAMLPSTGYLKTFKLIPHFPGIEVLLPDPEDVMRVAKARDERKLMQTYGESVRWATILGCENLSDLNELTENGGIREFIRVNEALQEKKIAQIAEQFSASRARLILISGPSSSGKTTFANRLIVALRVLGFKPQKLSMDDYYLDRDKVSLGEDGKPDYERPDLLDVPLFNEQLESLLEGEEVKTPAFDFVTGKRSLCVTARKIEQGQPIIVEGIHALNRIFSASVPREQKFLIYVSALTTLNMDDHNRLHTSDMRLMRRLVRDAQFRGTPAKTTLSMWKSVRAGEEKYIFPYQESADVMFNSSLVYEVCALKKCAYPALLAISEADPEYTLARRLVKFLNYVLEADVEDEIPLNSILREFVGGSCFYRR